MTNPLRIVACGALVILGGALLGSCAKPDKPKPPKNPDAHKQFQALDTNKDGKLGYEEFLKSPMARKSDNRERLFDEIDTTGDNYITVSEWRAFKLKNKTSN